MCFKSLLKRNNRKIVIPNPEILSKDYLITDIVEKIVKKLGFKPKFNKKNKFTNNYKGKICNILLTSLSEGQKSFEEFVSKKEKILVDIDKSICKMICQNTI